MAATVLIINGPNLNMLGVREPEVYGHDTLADIEARLHAQANPLGIQLECFQSNHEGEIVTRIQKAYSNISGIIINPAAYTHTSIAIRDALSMHKVPIIEVHLSDIHAREPFRHHSYISDLAAKVIMGQGSKGYTLALAHMAELLA